MKKFSMILLAVLSVALSAKTVETRLNYRIVVSDAASPVENTAAKELKNYLGRIFSVPLTLNGTKEEIVFFAGYSPEAEKAGFAKPEELRKESAFGVWRKGRNILLAGHDDLGVKPFDVNGDQGTLLAAYYFLRRYAGLRVYAPDPVHGEKIPKDPVLTVGEKDVPVFSFAVRGMGTRFKEYTPMQVKVYHKKQLCTIPYWADADCYYQVLNRWPKRFKNHPEFFSLYNGKRYMANYPCHIPCLSNPEVKKIITEDILNVIRTKKKGVVHTLRMFSDAPVRQCECPECRKFASRNDWFYGFILDRAEEIRKFYPDMWVFLQEKTPSHTLPPSQYPKLKNVMIDIKNGYPAVTDYRQTRHLFKAWCDRGARPIIRVYSRMPAWKDYPVLNPHSIARSFRSVADLAYGQRFSDQISWNKKIKDNPDYAVIALTNYTHAELLKNVNRPVEDIISEFCAFMYPGAEKEMCLFYAEMEKLHEQCPENTSPLLTGYRYYNLKKPEALLGEAEKKCTDSFWLKQLRISFDKFKKQTLTVRTIVDRMDADSAVFRKLRDDFLQKHPIGEQLIIQEKPLTLELFPINGVMASMQRSQASVSRVKEGLCLELTAEEEFPDEVKADAAPQTRESVWSDDSFEIFLTSDSSSVSYLQIGINPAGYVQVLRYAQTIRGPAAVVDGTLFSGKATKGKGCWKVSLVVPDSLLKEICPKGKGRLGIYRNRILRKTGPQRDLYRSSYGLPSNVPNGNFHDWTQYYSFELR